ncbi:hypothetical protein LCGC14_0884700 [marine sediment metagenome]|uniref:Uncharacterized protein n=1 Tax=marine sediment metagenome TaxID=412755 RepID=A0A0F9S7V3_9ZZZZ
MEENVKLAINELQVALGCIDTFKKKENWKILGFEIAIHNAILILKREDRLKMNKKYKMRELIKKAEKIQHESKSLIKELEFLIELEE